MARLSSSMQQIWAQQRIASDCSGAICFNLPSSKQPCRRACHPPHPLSSILKQHHVPTRLGHADRRPFAPLNQLGGPRLCMPTVVSYLHSRAFRPKDNGALGEGEVYNRTTRAWEAPDTYEKELLLGYLHGDTVAVGVSDEDRAIRLGRALEGNTMRWLGAFLHACQA